MKKYFHIKKNIRIFARLFEKCQAGFILTDRMLPCNTHIRSQEQGLFIFSLIGVFLLCSIAVSAADSLHVQNPDTIPSVAHTDSLATQDSLLVMATDSLSLDSLHTDSLALDTLPVIQLSAEESLRASGFPILELKTNLLFDAALTPNIEVECPIAYYPWSIVAEWWFPWYVWRIPGSTNSYSFMMAGLEGRYWIRQFESQPRVLNGHFVGVYGAGGLYDIQLSKDGHGYQGVYGSGGFTYGYAITLIPNLHMEFSIGVGYMGGPQRAYKADPRNDHLVLLEDRHFWYLGPTKLKISIGYLFHLKNK